MSKLIVSSVISLFFIAGLIVIHILEPKNTFAWGVAFTLSGLLCGRTLAAIYERRNEK